MLALISARVDHLHQRGQLLRMNLRTRDLPQVLSLAVGIEQPEQLTRDPVGHALRAAVLLTIGGDRGLEVVGNRLLARDGARILRPQAPILPVALLLRVRQFGQGARRLLHPLPVYHQRRQVRLREVAVVLAALLRALQHRALPLLVPAHIHLLDRAAALQHAGLAFGLIGDGVAHARAGC